MALTTTTTVASTLSQYYDKRFLMRSEENFVLERLGTEGRIPAQAGKIVVWNRWTNPTAKTTALTEGVDPTPTGLSAALVSAAMSQYGNFEQITDILDLTSVDKAVKAAIDLLAYEAAKTIDAVIRTEIVSGGIVQYANTALARNSLVPTDTISVRELRKARRTLSRMAAQPYKGGQYVGVIHPDVTYDLQGDTNWVNAHTYTERGIDNVYNGEVGQLYGVRFVESTHSANVLTNSGSAGTEVYQTLIMGKDYFGVSKLQNLTTYVDSPSPRSALRLYSDVGWKAAFAVKVLNDSFAVRIESGATA